MSAIYVIFLRFENKDEIAKQTAIQKLGDFYVRNFV